MMSTVTASPSSSSPSSSSSVVVEASSTNTMASTTSTTTNNTTALAPSSLPLDWTRVKRRRRRRRDGEDDSGGPDADDDDEEEDCCQDPTTCQRRRVVRPKLSKSQDSITTTTTTTTTTTNMMTKGTVIVCLHDLDATWMQGYWFPGSTTSSGTGTTKKPWGLLAVQQEVDDCLACQDGGYRQLSLTIYYPKNNNNNNNKKTIQCSQVEWTGGDMMTWEHPKVTLETTRFYTGASTLPFVKRYFQPLVTKLRQQQQQDPNNNNDVSILSIVPDLAIVVGTMSIALPTTTTSET